MDIDNPTKKEQQITVDDKVILLKPQSTTTIKVERGYHNLYMANDSVMDYKFYEDHYLINPTSVDYILEKFNYSKFSNSNRDLSDALFNKQNAVEVVFMGYTIKGNYEVYNNVVIPKDWHFGPRVELPDEITVENMQFSHSRTIRKMFAPDEFIQYTKDQMSENE